MDKRFWLLHHSYKNRHYGHQRSSNLGYVSPGWRGKSCPKYSVLR